MPQQLAPGPLPQRRRIYTARLSISYELLLLSSSPPPRGRVECPAAHTYGLPCRAAPVVHACACTLSSGVCDPETAPPTHLRHGRDRVNEIMREIGLGPIGRRRIPSLSPNFVILFCNRQRTALRTCRAAIRRVLVQCRTYRTFLPRRSSRASASRRSS